MTYPSESDTRQGEVGAGYRPALKKRGFVPEDPRKAARARTDFRTILAMTLWGAGVLLALLGNWLRWEWLALPAPLPYPDQVWGDRVDGTWENLLVFISLGLLLAAAILGWLTGWSRPSSRKPRWLYRLATGAKWITVMVSGAALIALTILAYHSLGDWWMIFPGWAGQWFAQACVLAGALILPSPSNPYRNAERENHPRAWALGAALIGFAFLLPWAVVGVVDWTQETSTFNFARDADLEISTVESSGNFGGSGVVATTSEGQQVWERMWKGAREPSLVESIGGGTVAARLFQATPNRDAFVLLDRNTGQVRAALSDRDLTRRHLRLTENPNYTRITFTYDNTMLRAGNAEEWVTNQGQRLPGPPRNSVEETNSFKVPVDGVHATDLVQGGTWFIGDSGSCDRRLLTVNDAPIAAPDGTFVMYQVCDASTENYQDWAFPEELLPYVRPLTVTLFGVNPRLGDIVWSESLPGWERYLEQNPTDFPSGIWRDIPFETGAALSEDTGDFTVSIDGVASSFNAGTGLK